MLLAVDGVDDDDDDAVNEYQTLLVLELDTASVLVLQ